MSRVAMGVGSHTMQPHTERKTDDEANGVAQYGTLTAVRVSYLVDRVVEEAPQLDGPEAPLVHRLVARRHHSRRRGRCSRRHAGRGSCASGACMQTFVCTSGSGNGSGKSSGSRGISSTHHRHRPGHRARRRGAGTGTGSGADTGTGTGRAGTVGSFQRPYDLRRRMRQWR